MAMDHKPLLTPFLILFLSQSLLLQALAKNLQAKTLDNFYRKKFIENPNGIDKSLFDGSHRDFHKVEIHPSGCKEDDLIELLPGQPKLAKFDQYGGYVTVDRKSGRAFYYYFVEAQNPKKTKDQLPLLLWLNGGPGCSSLAYGAMQELGPFRVNSDGKTLFRNRFSWNYAANVLFLESPAGVGFSYSNKTKETVKGGDKHTAKDNYAFLLNWLERFPEYKDRDFYITGESYAGHYVPQFADVILKHNLKANKTIVNLKGILIGNAAINDETDSKGMYEYFGTHALVSDETTSKVLKFCNFSSAAVTQSALCKNATDVVDTNINNINIYNIYGPVCHSDKLTEKPKRMSMYMIDPCSDNYGIAYFNRPEVQRAIHANVTNIPYEWSPCSDRLLWEDSPSTIIPLLQEFMANGIRVWIFSGDTDGRVPVTSTKQSIKKMKLPIKTPWYAWFLSGEVGGYTQVYNEGKLRFATVRGAGHQVPSYQPARALSLISHFLDDTPLPS